MQTGVGQTGVTLKDEGPEPRAERTVDLWDLYRSADDS